MRKKDSNQILFLKRLLSLCSERTGAQGFTLDDIARWPPIKRKGLKRKSIDKAMRRFIKLNFVFSPGADSKNKTLFRISNHEWAQAYIAGDPLKPWLSLTPTPQVAEFPAVDEHRDHFDIELTKEWFEVLRHHAQVKNRQHTWRHKSFTISINEISLRGQLFIKLDWRAQIKRHFGADFYEYIADLDRRGMRQGDFCLPLGMMGQRLSLGGRATQFSASHSPAQLDVRTRKNDKNCRDGLYGLTNQGDFNIRILDTMDAIMNELREIGEFLKDTSEQNIEIMKGVNENMRLMAEYLKKNGKKEEKVEYQVKVEDDEHYMFG